MAVVKADDRDVLRDPPSGGLETLNQRIGDFVVVTDHGGTGNKAGMDKAMQPVQPAFQYGIAFFRSVPANMFVRGRNNRLNQLRRIALIALGTLTVVVFEDTGDCPVSFVQQIAREQTPAADVVILDTALSSWTRRCRPGRDVVVLNAAMSS